MNKLKYKVREILGKYPDIAEEEILVLLKEAKENGITQGRKEILDEWEDEQNKLLKGFSYKKK